jgi:hypothetical protein
MESKEQLKLISKIADKVLKYLKEWNMATRKKWQIMMDFENVNKICPLNFELLLNNEETLLHDYAGICMHFNRITLNWNENALFVPRSAIKE